MKKELALDRIKVIELKIINMDKRDYEQQQLCYILKELASLIKEILKNG